jgi:hypothetical protein
VSSASHPAAEVRAGGCDEAPAGAACDDDRGLNDARAPPPAVPPSLALRGGVCFRSGLASGADDDGVAAAPPGGVRITTPPAPVAVRS